MEHLEFSRHRKCQQGKKFDWIDREYLVFYNEKLLQFSPHLQTMKKVE